MNRRQFLVVSVAALAAGQSTPPLILPSIAQPAAVADEPFSRTGLIETARRLSEKPHQRRQAPLQQRFAEAGYDAYHDIRYKPEALVWSDLPVRFRLEPLHAGFLYREPVGLFLVQNGTATPLAFSSGLFTYGPKIGPPESDESLFYTGFRVRSPINRPDVWDEVLVFQGASYFRAVAKGLFYGLSARGLASKVGDRHGEEFPSFTRFWIEQPPPDASSLVIHALLESVTMTGAYRFSVRPGDMTVMDVEAVLFLREDSGNIGFAPLTSMYLFGDASRDSLDDFREAVHDSDGLQMLSGAGEHLWRPITNPSTLKISAFPDLNPRGFGLVQRNRRLEDYEDLQAHYERRPSLWIEPIGDWGPGFVELVEIPASSEFNDNIVAFWRPADPLVKGGPHNVTYRMSWCALPPDDGSVARVLSTRSGLVGDSDRKRLFVIDFSPLPGGTEGLEINATASVGKIANVVGRGSDAREGYRASFEFDPGDAKLSELKLRINAGGRPVSETWLFQWKR